MSLLTLGVGRAAANTQAAIIRQGYIDRVTAYGGIIEGDASMTARLNNLESLGLLSPDSLLLYPSGYKASRLYSQLPGLAGDLTWTRGGAANRRNSNNQIEQVSANIPRVDYLLGSTPMILMEPTRRNLLNNANWSGGGSNTAPTNWTRTNAGGTSNPVASLLGNTDNAIAYQFTTSTSREVYTQVLNTVANVTYVFSVQCETITSGSIQVQQVLNESANLTGTAKQFFEVVNGVATAISATTNVTPGRSYFMTYSNTVGGNITVRFGAGALSNTTVSMVISRPQIEDNGSSGSVQFATRYIPTTTGGSATRAADSFVSGDLTAAGILIPAGGTWLVELRNNVSYAANSSGVGLYLSSNNAGSGTGVNSIHVKGNSGTGRVQIDIRVANSTTTIRTTAADIVKLVIRWNGSVMDIWENGIQVVTAQAFAVNNLQFMGGIMNTIQMYIAQVELRPVLLSDAQCVSLST